MCDALMEIMEGKLEEMLEERMKDKLEEVQERGIERGIEQGMERWEILIQKLILSSRSDEIEKAATNKEYKNKLFEEFGI